MHDIMKGSSFYFFRLSKGKFKLDISCFCVLFGNHQLYLWLHVLVYNIFKD